MSGPLSIAAALFLSASTAASGPDVACVLDQTSAEDVAAIGGEVLAGAAVEEGGVGDRLSRHIATCIERFGWDEAQSIRVSTLSITAMARSVALERLGAAGIDVARLDRWFDGQSEAFRTRAFVDMNEEEAAATLDTLAGQALSAELFERNAELIGGYLAARVLALRGERGLPLE
jgi:hypothetical protein